MDILIEIKGGNIQEIFANDKNIIVHVIDYDNIESGDGLDLDPYPVTYTENTFRNFYSDIADPLNYEIYHELQRKHL